MPVVTKVGGQPRWILRRPYSTATTSSRVGTDGVDAVEVVDESPACATCSVDPVCRFEELSVSPHPLARRAIPATTNMHVTDSLC